MAGEDVVDEKSHGHVEDQDQAPAHMLGPDASDEMSLTIWQTIKANPKTLAYSLVLAMGPMVYGFDLIIVSLAVAMPSFQ